MRTAYLTEADQNNWPTLRDEEEEANVECWLHEERDCGKSCAAFSVECGEEDSYACCHALPPEAGYIAILVPRPELPAPAEPLEEGEQP